MTAQTVMPFVSTSFFSDVITRSAEEASNPEVGSSRNMTLENGLGRKLIKGSRKREFKGELKG